MHALSSIPYLPEAASTPIGAEVYRGLTAFPKHLSPWLFYDQRGSELFEAITALPEYYLTRTERAIFAEYGDEILAAASGDGKLAIIELGAGTAAKTGLLLAAAVRRQERVSYYPIDISVSALDAGRTRIGEEMPQVVVRPIVADYTTELDEIPTPADAAWCCTSDRASATSNRRRPLPCCAACAPSWPPAICCCWA